MKRLFRCPEGPIGGVCTGLGYYFNTDPVYFKLGFVFGTLFGIFPSVLTYIVLWIILPEKSI
jgi:phage shock protein PspC (stress-responsive transcriptional regulator)